MSRDQAPSRPINLHRRARGNHAPAVLDRLDAIQRDVEQVAKERRARDATTADRFRSCLRAICLDLFEAYAADPEMEIGVRRDRSALTANPWYPSFVTARPFLDALDGLTGAGYVEQLSLGNEASGRSTRVRATEELVDRLTIRGFSTQDIEDNSDPIRLKVGKPRSPKKRIAFAETEDTLRWRNNLVRINTNNARYRVSLDLSRKEWAAVEEQRWLDAATEARRERRIIEYVRINLNRTQLHRVFNSPDWSEGGRFYGAWWQSVPRSYRSRIRIDGKPTCERDFSSLHMRILYAEAGAVLPDAVDPYSGPFGAALREPVKRAFNAMLNAQRRIEPATVPEFSQADAGMTWSQFLDGITAYFRPIAPAFGTGVGLRLQRRDADIAERIMLRFVAMSQPCLPVHDSFITFSTLEDELAAIMSEAAHEVVGQWLPEKLSFLNTYDGPPGPVTMDISDILEEMQHEGWQEPGT